MISQRLYVLKGENPSVVTAVATTGISGVLAFFLGLAISWLGDIEPAIALKLISGLVTAALGLTGAVEAVVSYFRRRQTKQIHAAIEARDLAYAEERAANDRIYRDQCQVIANEAALRRAYEKRNQALEKKLRELGFDPEKDLR